MQAQKPDVEVEEEVKKSDILQAIMDKKDK